MPLQYGGTALPDLEFVEGLVSHLCLDRPEKLRRYRDALRHLRDEALDVYASAEGSKQTAAAT